MKYFILFCILQCSYLLGATDLSTYKPEVKVNKTKTGFEFVIEIPKDVKYRFEAPWKLAIDGSIPFKQGKKFKLGAKDFKNKRFTLSLKEKAKGTSEYKVRYALCDKKGDKCKLYRKEGKLKV